MLLSSLFLPDYNAVAIGGLIGVAYQYVCKNCRFSLCFFCSENPICNRASNKVYPLFLKFLFDS